MAQYFRENAHLKTDQKKFNEEHERIFGKKESPFCDKCEKRHSYCECKMEKEDEDSSPAV